MGITQGFVTGMNAGNAYNANQRSQELHDLALAQEEAAGLARRYQAIAQREDGTWRDPVEMEQRAPGALAELSNHPMFKDLRDASGKTTRITRAVPMDGPLREGEARPFAFEAEWLDDKGTPVSKGPITDGRTNDPKDTVTKFTTAGFYEQMMATLAEKAPGFSDKLMAARKKSTSLAANGVLYNAGAHVQSLGQDQGQATAQTPVGEAPQPAPNGLTPEEMAAVAPTGLTPAQAAEIKAATTEEEKVALARKYGVSEDQIQAATRGRAGAATPTPTRSLAQSNEFTPGATDEQIYADRSTAATGNLTRIRSELTQMEEDAKLFPLMGVRKAAYEDKKKEFAAAQKNAAAVSTNGVTAVEDDRLRYDGAKIAEKLTNPTAREQLTTDIDAFLAKKQGGAPTEKEQKALTGVAKAVAKVTPLTTQAEGDAMLETLQSMEPRGKLNVVKPNRKQADAVWTLYTLGEIDFETAMRFSETGRLTKQDLKFVSDLTGTTVFDAGSGALLKRHSNPDYKPNAGKAKDPLDQAKKRRALIDGIIDLQYPSKDKQAGQRTELTSQIDATISSLKMDPTHDDTRGTILRAITMRDQYKSNNDGFLGFGADNRKFPTLTPFVVAQQINKTPDEIINDYIDPLQKAFGGQLSDAHQADLVGLVHTYETRGNMSREEAIAAVAQRVQSQLGVQ